MNASHKWQKPVNAYSVGSGPSAGNQSLSVVVVGAGLAGLTATHLLSLSGCKVLLFEGSNRLGGRIRTEQRGAQVWELGGEFIDQAHKDIRALAASLKVPLLDTLSTKRERSLATRFYVDGKFYTEAQVERGLSGIVSSLAKDSALLMGRRPSFNCSNPDIQKLDRLSIEEYLNRIAMDDWLRSLLCVAYGALYGQDAGNQSALNLLTVINAKENSRIGLFGSSDERYKFRDGSQSLIDALVRKIGDAFYPATIALGHNLVRVARVGGKWRLTFLVEDGKRPSIDADADVVVMAIPFSTLRKVEWKCEIPPQKARSIEQLQYGINCKLLLGTNNRIWRDSGFDGNSYTDTSVQSSWDCSRQRIGSQGVFTIYLGGTAARNIMRTTSAEVIDNYVEDADRIFPGLKSEWTGEHRVAAWPTEPYARGSYTCYSPGQWTTIGGVESQTLDGSMYFAGEHCARKWQGYMNGAAQSGRIAATKILKKICR